MARIDVSELKWTLEGWRPFCWRMGKSMETSWGFEPDLGPFEAKVPGTVQKALRDAGVLPDWHVGVDSRACEWVEHRHWFFSAVLPAGSLKESEPVSLVAEGVDYSGWIIVDGREVARFEGALIPHRFDLTEVLADGKEHRLGIVFEEPPREQGQIGYTSRSRFFKPRYSYSWDWCPRFVPIGVWDALYLESGMACCCHLGKVRATLAEDNRSATLEAELLVEGMGDSRATVTARLMDGYPTDSGHPSYGLGEVTRAVNDLREGMNPISLNDLEVEPWWPNGLGDAKTYRLEVVVEVEEKTVWRTERMIGFKRIEWRACEGASPDAEPWICVVNGEAVFLQGVNWVPPRVGYADTTVEEYEKLIALYKDMGCNLLRVWGGAILEKEVFYDLCDRAGLFVWQEFPLSSSGIDNCPPVDEAAIGALTDIASSYIERRAHHVSLLLWCGGNELFDTPGQTGGTGDRPVTMDHPCIAALRQVVEREDPERRFLSASPSGLRLWGTPEEWGKGVHHDVHGPWGMPGTQTLDEWRAYWEADDALFRSEVGMPGAMELALIKRCAGGMQTWPPEGEYWRHTAAWWTQRERFAERLDWLDDEESLADYVRLTQELQADAYRIAAGCCKRRFPRCGGFLVWMGHDCFPCPANNSVIDFEGNAKPAYDALREVFRGDTA